MHHVIPYLVLSAADLALLLFTWLRFRESFMFILLLTFAGMVYVFEYVIMVLLDSYSYMPHVVPDKPYQDNTIGAMISNLITVPAVGVFIVISGLGWVSVVGITVLIFMIEWIFVHCGVYELHWWRLAYTFAALNFFFPMNKAWAAGLSKGSRVLSFVTLLMSSFSLAATLMFVLSLAGVRLFQAGVFADPYRDDIFLATLDALFKAAVLSGVLFFTRSWLWRGSLLLLFIGLQYYLLASGRMVLFIPTPMYFGIYLLCCLLVMLLIDRMDRRIKRFGGQPYA